MTFKVIDHWRLVRRLVRERLCDRPRSSRYIHGMIAALHTFGGRSQVLQELRDDPGLLDDEIWDIFETEPERGMLSLLSAEKTPAPAATWEGALAALAGEGRLSRSRLLDASLSGLERDFHEQRARWFALMHETLLPTVDEQTERVDRYLGLAASRNPSTVSFALKTLTALEKAGRLEAGSVVASVGPVLLARARGRCCRHYDCLIAPRNESPAYGRVRQSSHLMRWRTSHRRFTRPCSTWSNDTAIATTPP